MIDYVDKKIDFTDPNKTGVQVPDGMITVGATDTYKLLEALNLDWKNINLPWAKFIQRWNSVFPGARDGEQKTIDSSPFLPTGENKTKEQYLEGYTETIDGETVEHPGLNYQWNNLTNSVDWMRRNYDYLTDNGYIFEKDGETYVGIPNWSAEGKISESEDIVDVLNYLLWRVINLDYFTANWDRRNSLEVMINYGISWNELSINTVKTILTLNESEPFGQYIYNKIWSGSNEVYLSIKDNDHRSDKVYLHSGLSEFEEHLDDANLNNFYLSILSNSPGALVRYDFNRFPENTVKFVEEDNLVSQEITGTDGSVKYLFNCLVEILGTGNYNSPDVWFNNYINNGTFTDFDPIESGEYSFQLLQQGDSNDENAFSEKTLDPVSITVTKDGNKNEIYSMSIGGQVVIPISLAGNTNDYATVYDSTDTANIPFYYEPTTPDTGYEIEITDNASVKYYDETYGIHKYFAIEELNDSGTAVLNRYLPEYDEFNNFIYCGDDIDFLNPDSSNKTPIEGGVGTIRVTDDGRYFYMPPKQPAGRDTNKNIRIRFALYYNDTVAPRQIIPTVGSFNVLLTGRITNRIIFLPADGTIISKYNVGLRSFQYGRYAGTEAVRNDANSGSFYNNADEINPDTGLQYPVSYCVRTLNYSDGSERNAFTTLNFTSFVTTYCSNDNDIKVEFIGYTHSTSYFNRNIEIDPELEIIDTLNRIYPNRDDENVYYTLSQNQSIKIGPDEFDKNIIYSEDNPYNYVVPSDLIEPLTTREKIVKNADLNIADIPTSSYISSAVENNAVMIGETTVLAAQNTTYYDIEASTAEYPTENGIISDGTKYVDADNDYYYLMFRITAPEGTIGNISFTPCEGYYFIRILRNTLKDLALTFVGDTTSQINYISSAGIASSFRLMAQTPIYLNRLFSEQSQDALSRMNGKLYWGLYGDTPGEAFSLDENILALKNKNTDEEYIKIFNEGDNCSFKTVVDPTPDSYNQYINASLENNKTIDFNGTPNTVIGHFNTVTDAQSSSGAVLWANKLMHATGDATEPYAGITDSNQVSLVLKFSIGNSEKYIRYTSPNLYSVTIHKRIYDIDFQKYIYTTLGGTISFLERNEGKTMTNPLVIYKQADYPKNSELRRGINMRNISTTIYLTSNEFGSGEQNDIAEDIDKIFIYNDGEYPTLRLTNESGIEINPTILLRSTSINTDWVLANTYARDRNYDKNILLVYFTDNNTVTSGNEPVHGAIFLLGVQTTGQSPQLIQFDIDGDEYGIYQPKTLNLYVSVKDPTEVTTDPTEPTEPTEP